MYRDIMFPKKGPQTMSVSTLTLIGSITTLALSITLLAISITTRVSGL